MNIWEQPIDVRIATAQQRLQVEAARASADPRARPFQTKDIPRGD
jgi:hypothetical protein